MDSMSGFSEELKKLKIITSKLTENGYLVDRTAQWEFAFDAVQDLVLIVNPNLEIKFINKAFADRLEVDRATIINNYCYNVVQCPNCQKTPGDCFLSYAQPAKIENGDVYIEDHLQGWFNFTHSPIYDDEENLLGFICVLNDITERKQAEKALRESEEKYRNLVERANDGVIILQEGKVKFANTRLTEMFGYTTQEMVNTNFIDYVFPDERSKIMDIYKRRLQGEDVPEIYEMAALHKNGRKVPIETNSGLITFNEGPATLTLIRDTTERKKAEVLLRESEEKYQDLYDNAPDMFVSVDAETAYITRCNQTLLDALGYTREEVVGQPIFFVYAPESIEKAKETFHTFVETGEIRDVHMQLQKKDGSKLDVSLNVTAIKDDDGNIIQSRSSWRDITEYREMEDALRKSEEKYRSIYETAPLAFVVWDYETKIIEWNKNAERMFGYTKEEVEGKNFFDFIIPKTAKEHVQKVVDLLRLGEVTTSINENITKDGSIILCEWNNSLYHDCNGKPIGFISLASDITELKEKEDLIKSIFKASPAGIGLVKDRVIQWTNQRMRDMIGYTEEELANQSSRILYPSDEEYQRVGDVKYQRLDRNGFGYVKTVWQKKDGELVDILLSSAYVDDSDHLKGVTFTATDIINWD